MRSGVWSAIGLVLATAMGVRAAQAQGATAFTGTWKVDVSKLSVEGPTFTFAVDPQGFSIRYSDGMGPKQVCDGSAKPFRPGYTRTCTKTDTGYSVQTMHDDKQIAQAEWSLSADALHERRVYTNDDGSSDTREVTAARVGKGSGFAGEWRVTGFTDTAFTKPYLLTGSATTLGIQRPGDTKPDTFPLDGTDVELSKTVKASMKLDAPATLHERVSRDGKIFSERVLVLSTDGATLTETETHPASPADKTVTVYVKQ